MHFFQRMFFTIWDILFWDVPNLGGVFGSSILYRVLPEIFRGWNSNFNTFFWYFGGTIDENFELVIVLYFMTWYFQIFVYFGMWKKRWW